MSDDFDYLKGYRASMEQLKETPGFIEMDALCWHAFNSDDGRKLIEVLKDKVIYQATPAKINDSYGISCIYMEGYRAAFRYLIEMVKSYQDKKDYQAKENQSKEGN